VTGSTSEQTRAPVVGLVGGLASGKSTVAELLARRGARVLDADRMAHRVLERPAIKERVRAAFGADVLDEAGRVDRDRLARKVFGDPDSVRRLEGILHPPVVEEIRREARQLRSMEGVPLVVVDAPLLLEVKLEERLCDALLFVDTPEDVRRRRARELRALSPDQFRKRSDQQMPVAQKRTRADYIVSNSGTMDELARQIDALWPRICRPVAADQT